MRAEERVTEAQQTRRPSDSPANAGILSIHITTHSYLKRTLASEWKIARESLQSTYSPVCTHIWEDNTMPFFPHYLPGTWKRTIVEIQMVKNSPGVSLQTQEYAQCSAPTSLSAASRTVLSVVRNLTALFDAESSKGKAYFFSLKQKNIWWFLHFVHCRIHMRLCTTHISLWPRPSASLWKIVILQDCGKDWPPHLT